MRVFKLRTVYVLLVVNPFVFFLLEGLAAQAWVDPPYSYRFNRISDLGNPVPHDVILGVLVNSPLYFVINFGFLIEGVAFAVITVSLKNQLNQRRGTALTFGLCFSLGMLLIAVFHQQSVNVVELVIHGAGAVLILMATLLELLIGITTKDLKAPSWYRALSMVLGITGFLSFFGAVVPIVNATLGAGLCERTSLYGFYAWQMITGVLLLASSRPERPA